MEKRVIKRVRKVPVNEQPSVSPPKKKKQLARPAEENENPSKTKKGKIKTTATKGENSKVEQDENERVLRKSTFTADNTPVLYIDDFDDLDLRKEAELLLPREVVWGEEKGR